MYFKQLIQYPRYIFKFGMCLVFIFLPIIIYFRGSNFFKNRIQEDIFLALTLLYGIYRFVRTYHEYKAERHEEDEFNQ
ncbi:MAG: hypothetical protein IT245_02910 [Bacteroidia bacterium]|nr:hypothetical protein [Bacteroidia bacterium]